MWTYIKWKSLENKKPELSCTNAWSLSKLLFTKLPAWDWLAADRTNLLPQPIYKAAGLGLAGCWQDKSAPTAQLVFTKLPAWDWLAADKTNLHPLPISFLQSCRPGTGWLLTGQICTHCPSTKQQAWEGWLLTGHCKSAPTASLIFKKLPAWDWRLAADRTPIHGKLI